jgi:hypothetical protein
MALPLPVYIVVSALSLGDRDGQTLIHSDYSILLDLVNQYHSTPIIHIPLQLSIRQILSLPVQSRGWSLAASNLTYTTPLKTRKASIRNNQRYILLAKTQNVFLIQLAWRDFQQ